MLLLVLVQRGSLEQDSAEGLQKCHATVEEGGLLDIPFILGYSLQKFCQTFSMAYNF